MNIKRIIAITLLPVTVAACQGGYAGSRYMPVIDVYGSTGKYPEQYQPDLDICNQLAAQRPQVREAARGAGVGALVGAAAGAIGGAIAGAPGIGAGYGAAAGALLGGAGSGLNANSERQGLVMTCMRNRGWEVLGR